MLRRSMALAVVAATFVAGSAFAADDFEIGVSGYINAGIMGTDVDNDIHEYDSTSIRMDNIINIEGETVLDNGLKVSAVAGFSLVDNSFGATANQDLQDHNLYVQVGGSFGDVRLGRSRNAGALLHSFIPSAGVGSFGVDDARTNAFVAGYHTTATSIGEAEYANRIAYFTPRVEGLQLAASFTPETNPDHNPALQGLNRFGGVASNVKNEYSLAANYNRQFSGVGVNASFGFTEADAPGGSATAVRDLEAIHAGLNLNYAGFTIGGAWGQYEDPSVASGRTDAYGAGAKYETGPWGFGASFLQRKASNAASGFAAGANFTVEKATFYEVGATYALGSGVTAGAGVYYNDNTEAVGVGNPEDSLSGVLNLSVAF